MKRMVEAEGGFLAYDEVCRDFGKYVTDSLIQHNLVHLRPTKCFLKLQIDGVAVLTP